ncbi:mRNA-decapping enzyme 1B [Toensbergia leucococca]|nr:mRNA-decapping enzyme 1B [Toensbergia leucococca]
MTPRKDKPRQPQPLPSDNDSDLLTAPPPPPPLRSNAELNLSVLKRHDPAILSILSLAPYAVVYIFSPASQQWEKSGIEGTMFVCQLALTDFGAERYSVVVLNRHGLENFRAELRSANDVETTEEYVIIQSPDRKGEPQVYGLWIFSEPAPSSTAEARAVNAQIIQECAARAEMSRPSQPQRDSHQVVEKNPNPTTHPSSLSPSPTPQYHQQRTPPPKMTPFALSADTEFFRTSKRNAQQQVPSRPSPAPQSPQPPDILGDLFRKASQTQ